MSADVGPGPDLLQRRPFNAADAESLLWVEAAVGSSDFVFEPEDWYEAMSVLMAERAPA